MTVFGWKPEKRSPVDVVSGPITANAAALGLRCLDARLGFLGCARQALAYDARGVPLRCVNAEGAHSVQHVFTKKCNTAAAAKERETAWENIASRVNA